MLRIMLLFLLSIYGCTLVDENENISKSYRPKLACGIQCLTIKQDQSYKKELKAFLKQQNPGEVVLLSPCEKVPASPVFMEKVARDIVVSGLQVAKSRPVIPHDVTSKACLVLVRGPVILHPPKCQSVRREPGAFFLPKKIIWVSDNFGCYSQQNLARMLNNPKDLLVLGGYSGKVR